MSRLNWKGLFSRDSAASLLASSLEEILERGQLSARLDADRNSEIESLTGTINRLLGRAEKAEQEVIHLKALLEEARTARQTFLTNLSHEFNTPLNGILGSLQLLSALALPEDVRLQLGQVESCAKSLHSLLRGVLEFSRLESGGTREGRLTDFVLRDLLEEVSQPYLAGLSERAIKLEYRIDDEIPQQVRADRERLGWVLDCLVSNASKFTEKGRIQIRATLESLEEDEFLVHLSVLDTGIGVAREQLEQIFSPFFQVSGGHTRQVGGIGLGLALARSLVQHLGGRIWAESELGRGSNFQVACRMQRAGEQAATPSEDGRNLAGQTVALDDPDEGVTAALHTVLQSWGLSVQGREAVALTDLVVVGLPGDEPDWRLVEQLKQSGVEGSRLIVMVNRLSPAELGRADALKVVACLRRPPEPSDLWQALLKVKLDTRSTAPRRRVARSPRGAGPVILVAEDNPLNRSIIEQFLKGRTCRTRMVHDGRQAVEAVLDEPPDLILMDVQMPVLDGLDATREIREWERARGGPPIPIVALTAHASEDDRSACMTAGMDEFLTKPVDFVQLLEMVEGFLGPIPLGDPVESRPEPPPRPVEVEGEGLPTLAEVVRVVGGSEKVAGLILDQFLTHAGPLWQEIKAAHESARVEELALKSHTLKGSSGYVAGRRVVELCAQLEREARAGRCDQRALPELDTALQALIEHLRALRATLT